MLAALERQKCPIEFKLGMVSHVDRVIIKVAGNQDRHKSLKQFDFRHTQIADFRVNWLRKKCILIENNSKYYDDFWLSDERSLFIGPHFLFSVQN